MPRWDGRYFGIALKNKDNLDYAEKILECWDIKDFGDYFLHGESYGESAFGENWDLFGIGAHDAEVAFGILNKLFGKVKVCAVEDIGDTIADYEMYYAHMYDSSNKKGYSKNVNYCESDGTVGEDFLTIHEVLKWEELREKIEKRVESVNGYYPENEPISISWIQGENGIEPASDNEPFKQICDEVFEEIFSYEEYGTTCFEWELSENYFEIDEGELESLLRTASNKGYYDLVDFITKRMNSEDIPDSTASEEESTEKATDNMEQHANSIAVPTNLSDEKTIQKTNKLSGSVVVTTGLAEEEEVLVKELVELNGGVFRDYFVKKVTYLVRTPKYRYSSKKLTETKKLIEQGKDVKILTLEEFITLLK